MNGPQARLLPDGRRLHLNHGPIDLIIEAFGDSRERAEAYRLATARFATVLDELVSELPSLRLPAGREPRAFNGAVARRMETAVARLGESFITPMAAVAGSVADEVLAAMAPADLTKAYVNNGGDIAFMLTPGTALDAAISGAPGNMQDRLTIGCNDKVRGIATSGWRGRSFSLGIADAVTVLAADGAMADAAATLIANAVDLPGHPAIRREPADRLQPDSDLGSRPVTTNVGRLTVGAVETALASGLAVAEAFRQGGLIAGAALFLGGRSRVTRSLKSLACDVAPFSHAGHLPYRWGDWPIAEAADLPPRVGEISRTEGAGQRGRERMPTIHASRDERHA